jgi:DNA polymerase-3 subunit epsilon
MHDQTFTIVDVETTGADAYRGRVIEIGLLRVEHGEVAATYKTFLNPDQPIPEFITKMTGIDESDVAGAPRFADIAESLLELFAGATFVAHNAQFDYSFLREEFRRVGLAFNLPRLCTVRLSRSLYPEHKRHNLTALIERFQFSCENRHRAFDDAHVLWQFLQHVQTTLPAEDVQKHYQRVLQPIVRLSEYKPRAYVPEDVSAI